MDFISTLIFVVCGYSCLIGAMILTKYERSSPMHVSGLASCGENAAAFDFCAARVTNNTCDPLVRDWCVTKNMSDGGAYIIKQKVTEIFKDTLMSVYVRQIPVYLNEGSELELRFRLNSGWTQYGINLKDESGNIILHTKLLYPDGFFFNSKDNNVWANEEGYMNTFSFTDGANYTFKIVCATSGFRIYLNGTLEWTYIYRQPANTIRLIDSYFYGAQGDLYQATYKAAP